MVTGSRAFDAASQAELVAAILEHEPTPLATRQPAAPLALERVVATCLAKDPADRWQSSKDLLRELTWIRDDRVTRAAPATSVRKASRAALAVAAVLGLTILAVIASPWRSASTPERTSFSVYPPDGTTFPRGTAEMAVSPDGRRLVFVALGADGTRRLWLRRFDAVDEPHDRRQ